MPGASVPIAILPAYLQLRTLCRPTADDDARPLLRGSGDRGFVFTLDRRVRDLKDIKNTHGNMVDQMGQCARHADEPHLAGLSELQECFERAVLFQGLPRWRRVKLHNVEIIGLHPHKALFDPGHDVVAGEDVLPPLAARRRGCADQTATLAGQVIFSAPVRDVAADPLLAQPVIDRGVDVVDA